MSRVKEGTLVKVVARESYKGRNGTIDKIHEGNFGKRWVDVKLTGGRDKDEIVRLPESDVREIRQVG